MAALAQIGFLRVLSYASLYRYTLNAFVQLQYRGRDDGCGLADDPQYQVGSTGNPGLTLKCRILLQ